jgi:hypothetical protein
MNTTIRRLRSPSFLGVSTRSITNWQTLGWLVRSAHKYDSAVSVCSVTKALQAAVQGRSNDTKLVEANVASRGQLAAA